jgi:hypothetical protein
MLYSICFSFSVWIFGIAETGVAHGSPPGTTTEVQRVGFPSTEIRFVSHQTTTITTTSHRSREMTVSLGPHGTSVMDMKQSLHSLNRRLHCLDEMRRICVYSRLLFLY